MRHAGVMHLPGPLRAAVGLAVTAAGEARRLPDRAIELPMLAVSTALQLSLRAQQRYAHLAERGDAVLNRRPVADDPPPWATFDDPVLPVDSVPTDDEVALTDVTLAAGVLPDDVLPDAVVSDAVVPDDVVVLDEPPPDRAPAAKKTARAPRKAAAKRTSTGKAVRKPRNGAPSRFDAVEDD